MSVAIVSLRTEDGLTLEALHYPASGDAPARADACVLLHGAGGSALGASQRGLSEGLAAAGVTVLCVNTRGHDVVSRLTRPAAGLGGVAFEDLDDAPYDVHAAINWLKAAGYQRIAIAGHSLGAVKVLYTQATRPNPDVVGVIAFSPPRFNHAYYLNSTMGPRFREVYAEAERLVAAGRPNELMVTDVPIASIFAAAQYVKKYSPEDRYDVARHLPNVNRPTFLLYGTREAAEMVNIGGTAALAREWDGNLAHLTVAVIEGADHVYTTTMDEVRASAIAWLRAPVAAAV